MFGPLIIDEGASLSMTAGRATYAALLRGDIVTLVSFVKILIQILLWIWVFGVLLTDTPPGGQSSGRTVLLVIFQTWIFPTLSSSQWCTDSLKRNLTFGLLHLMCQAQPYTRFCSVLKRICPQLVSILYPFLASRPYVLSSIQLQSIRKTKKILKTIF